MKKIILFIIACLIVCSCSKRDILEGTTWESPGISLNFYGEYAKLNIGDTYTEYYSYDCHKNIVTMVPRYNPKIASLRGDINRNHMTIVNLSSNETVAILTKK